MIDATRIERRQFEAAQDDGSTARNTLTSIAGQKLEMLRNNQYDMEVDMDTLQGAMRALGVLIGSNNNARDIDPSDFEFLVNLLIERADAIRDHMSFARRTMYGD